MKLLTPLLFLFVTATALAQLPPLDPARQAERDAVYGPSYLTPGNIGQNPGQGLDPYRPLPRPIRPQPPGRPYPPPPPPPYYGGDYGPQQTVRWQDNGLSRLPKLLSQSQTIYVGGHLVNEVLIRALDNRVSVDSAVAYLINGQVIDLRQLTGTIRDGQEIRSLLDYRYSLRVERIVIQASSSNLIGSRAQMQVILGLAD